MIFCNPIVEASDSLKVDIITFEWAFVIDTDLGSDLWVRHSLSDPVLSALSDLFKHLPH